MALLAKEGDVVAGGSMTRLATEDYVLAHAAEEGYASPLDMPYTIKAWWPSSALDSVSVGGSISGWDDAGPDNRDATQSTSAAKPTKRTVNGISVARFDGNDVLGYTPINPGSDFTVCALVGCRAGRSSKGIIGEFQTGYWGLGIDTAGMPNFFTWVGTGGQSQTSSDTYMGFGPRDLDILTAVCAGDGSKKLYLDGEQVASGSPHAPGNIAGGTAWIGGYPWDGSVAWLDDIAEVVVVDSAMIDTDRRLLELYMSSLGNVPIF